MERKKKIINGIELIYYESGSGKSLLFLHGGRLRALTFKKTIDKLSKNYHVIAPDIPGYGDSSTPKDLWTFQDYSNFFVSFIKQLEIKELIIVGYSLGGGVAYNIASAYEKVEKLVLIDSAGIEKTLGSQRKRDFDRLLFYLSHPQYFLTFLALIKEWILFIAKHLMDFRHIKIIRKGLNDSFGYLDNIEIPTSIIWAKDDKIFPFEVAKRLQKTIKKSQLFIVNGNHDWVLYEENKFIDYLNKALR